jgi:hypothetical protein
MHQILRIVVVLAVLLTGCSSADSTVGSETTTPQAPMTTLAPPPPETTTSTSTTSTTLPQPPTLETTPSAGDTVTTYRTSIVVTSEPGVILTIGEGEIPTDDNGRVSIEVLSSPGDNNVQVSATNEAGLSATSIVSFVFEPTPGWAVAIGDSVMLGTKPEIEKRIPGVEVDATVSRQFSAAPEMIRSLVAGVSPPELIIIGLGTNGPARESDFDAIMEASADVPLVAFINVRVPRQWEDTSNRVIAEGVARYENAVLVDWYSVATDRDDLFSGDGVHPKQPGRVILAELIANAVFPLGPPPLPVEEG